MKIHFSTTWRILLTIVLAIGMAGMPLHSAQAATICRVTTNHDPGTGSGSLRDALSDPSCGEIEFDHDMTIPLASALPDVGRAVAMNLYGANITISGENNYRVFHVTTSGNLLLMNMAIEFGSATGASGGAIYNEGSLDILNVTFYDNTADRGGAIENTGTLTVRESTFHTNISAFGAAIESSLGEFTIINSTLTGNIATSRGGGLRGYGNLTVLNTTIAGNQASLGGGGIDLYGTSGAILISNTILANNTVASAPGNCAGTLPEGVGDISWPDTDSTCPTSFAKVNPLLGVLRNHGGSTQDLALLPGSGAIDFGDYSTCMGTLVSGMDQRGVSRSSPLNKCDSGAFESGGFNFTNQTGTNQTALINTAFASPLSVTVSANDPYDPVDGGLVTFIAPPSGVSVDPELNVVTVSGGKVSENVTANGNTGSYTVDASANGVGDALFALKNVACLDPYTVTSNLDDGSYGTLRHAIGNVCDNGTINFDGDHTITLASSLPTIVKNVTIDGGTHHITMDGAGKYRIFSIDVGVTVTLNALTIQNGFSTENGAGIEASGNLVLTNSTLTGNHAQSGGALAAIANAQVVNSTFTNNVADDLGGAVNYNGGTGYSMTITNSTLAENTGVTGQPDGVILHGRVAPLTLTNTLIMNSVSSSTSCGSGVTDGGGNLAWGNPDCPGMNADPLLGALQDNGGPTHTIALLPGSPAIDAGLDSTCTTTDQRGQGRVGAHCDIGAFESQGFTFTNPSGDGQSTIVGKPFANPLQLTVNPVRTGDPVDGGVVTFTAPSSDASTNPAVNTATISSGKVSQSVTANGTAGGPYQVTVSASGAGSVNFSLTNVAVAVCQNAITVTSDADSGPGTLRQAIADLCPGGTITFTADLSGATITLASELSLNQDVTIDGSSLAEPIAISGPGKHCSTCFRVFTIGNSVTVTLDSLTIENGYAYQDDGGAIYIDGGTLTLSNSTIKGSSSDYGGAIANHDGIVNVTGSTLQDNTALAGGAIATANGRVNVTGSTLKNNSCTFYGGGAIYNRDSIVNVTDSTLEGNQAKYKLHYSEAGGGIYNAGTLTVTNSTFKNNTAYDAGGGIYENYDSAEDANSTATVTNSTLSGNLANTGGGIYIYQGTLNFANTIIAASTSGGDCYKYDGTIDANLNNLVQDGSCSDGGVNFISGKDPLLADLAYNGGPTQTMALLPGSAAIDAGNDDTCKVSPVNNLDQRGLPRPKGLHCDIGAFESQGFTFSAQTGSPQSTLINTAFANPLGLTVTANHPPEPVDGGVVTFTAPSSGASTDPAVNTATISGGAVSQSVTANGTVGGPYNATASASGASSVNFSLTNAPVCQSSITVTSNADSGPGTLREAITDLCPGGTITFDNTYTITLASALPDLGKNVTIDGSGHAITVDGGGGGAGAFSIFHILSGVTAQLNALTISHGKSGYGGGIQNEGTLTVSNSTVSGNIASLSAGGGIINNGTLNITNSMFIDNSARLYGGAIANTGTLNVTNSTFVYNKALSGGAIRSSQGMLQVTNSTFAGNEVTNSGSDIQNTGTAILTNTILTGPYGTNCSGTITDGGGNLVYGDTTCPGTYADPLLRYPPSNNGGPTQTMALLPGSPAIDAGIADPTVTTDQRGVSRPQGAGVDIGAFEQRTCTVTTDADGTTPVPAGSLREKISDRTCSVINFDADHVIFLGSALPDLDRDVTIDGSDHTIWVEGGLPGEVFAYSIFRILSGANVTLNALNIADGGGSFGGGIENEGTLTVSNSTLEENSVSSTGGGINNIGVLTVSNSTIAYNTAGTTGGGIANTGTLVVTNSTLAKNDGGGYGGGIFNGQNGSLTLTNSTLAENRASHVGGLFIDQNSSISFTNDIIAGSNGGDCWNGGSITTNKNNLVQDGTCGASLSGDPKLGSLGDNGGPTETMALLPGSPAIDAGDSGSAPAADQRGVPRPQGSGVDIGAFELRTCTVTSDLDGTTPIPAGSLREKISDRTCSVINFDADHYITLASALPDLGLGMTIDGGSHHVSVDGGGIVTIFTIPQFADVTLNVLTITHGHNQGIANYAHLTITNSTITNSSSDIDGGGILNEGTLTVTNSTIANNSAQVDGGGIYNAFGDVTLLNNTLAGNSAGGHGSDLSNDTSRGGSLYLANNIIAGSAVTDCYITNKSKNLTFGNNLIQYGCGSSNHVDPLLGPLQDNGGPTWTMALLAGSPAIDALDPSTCPAADQRGISRPQGALCDFGAYETTTSTTTLTFEAGPYTYRGTAFTATARVNGAGGLNQAVPVSYSGDCIHVSAGGCTASASYPGDATHTASSDSKSITITPTTLTVTPDVQSLTYADPVPAVSFYTFSVTGWIHGEGPATAQGYTAPTCGSAFTSTTPASPPTLTIDCGGNPDGTAGSATDYTFNYNTAALTIKKAASTTVVTFNAPYTYRGTAFTATAVVTGAGGLSQNLTVTYKGDCKNVTVTNGCTASASYSGDANHTGSSDSKSITITQALLTVAPNPLNPSVQYSDASPTITPSITGFVNGETASVLTKQPTCSTTRTVNSPAGTYPITCSGGSAKNYSFSYSNGTFTVTQEDAFLQYSGDSIAQINTNLNLRVTVWDSAAAGYPSTSPNPESKPKATIGDITKMWVQFNIYPEASCGTAGSTVAVLYAQVSDAPTLNDGIGTASITWKSSTEASYCVIARLVGDKTGATNLYYAAADAESAGILFYQNSGKFASGGGWIKDPAGLPGSFSLLARTDSKGNPFGQMVYVYNGTYTLNGVKIPAIYVIRSTALTAFSISGTNYPLTATLQGKCTIWVMKAYGGAPLYSDFNATCKAVAVDTNKTPTTSDTFALTVWDKNGVVYKTVPASNLTQGDVIVHLK